MMGVNKGGKVAANRRRDFTIQGGPRALWSQWSGLCGGFGSVTELAPWIVLFAWTVNRYERF